MDSFRSLHGALIADPNWRTRRLVGEILELENGFLEAEDSHALSRQMADHRPTLAIVSLELDSNSVGGSIRRLREANSGLSIVAIGDLDSVPAHQAAIAAGADRYLPKINLTALPQLVAELTL